MPVASGNACENRLAQVGSTSAAVCRVVPVADVYSAGVVAWHVPYRHYTKTTTINTVLITMTDNDNDDDSDKPVVSVICDVRTVAIIDSGNDNSDKQTCCVICDARR